MDENKIYRLELARRRLYSIAGKLAAALLMMAVIQSGLSGTLDFFRERPGQFLFLLLFLYGFASFFWVFVKLTGNWLIGIGAGLVALILLYQSCRQGQEESAAGIKAHLMEIVVLAGPAIDLTNILRYIVLRISVAREGAEIRRLTRAELKAYRERLESGEVPVPAADDSADTGRIPAVRLFGDCNSRETLEQRLAELRRIYAGSPDMLARINVDYSERIAQITGQDK